MSTIRRTIVVTAAHAPLARALTEGLAGPAGAGMFTTGLSATGAEPATHYVSSGMIQEEFGPLLENPDVLFAAVQEANPGQVTLAQCQALLAASTVQDTDLEDPFATLARLGLQIVQPTL